MSKIKIALASLLALILSLLIWVLGHSAWMVYSGLSEAQFKAHVAVVLRGPVDAKTKPSVALKAKLDRAVALFNDRQVQRIVVSGQINNDGLMESKEMGQYLIRKGVPRELIFVDNFGETFFFSASNTERLLRPHENLRSVMLVGQYYELHRAKLIFGRCGFNVVYSSYARHFEWKDIWQKYPKEILSYYPSLFEECPAPIQF